MERRKIFYKNPFKFMLIPIGVAAILMLVSYVVMQLWNNLLPAILHVSTITFWQAMGIFVLCKILFGFGKGGGFGNRGNWFMRRRMEEKFERMTPEERERFKQKMNDRMCGHRSGNGWGRRGWGNEQPATEEQKASK